MSEFGKALRLRRIFSVGASRRALILPVDDSLLSGPDGWLRRPQELVTIATKAGVSGLLGFPGFLRHHSGESAIPHIVNMTASIVGSQYTRKVTIGRVEAAVAMGADAVAVHINVGSAYETEMLRSAGKVVAVANQFGMPVLAIVYARTEISTGFVDSGSALGDPEARSKLVSHAGRIGVDLGFDAIKAQYTGSALSFAPVVEACKPVPVLVAGGAKVGREESLRMANDAIKAGASGISFGRNVFLRADPLTYLGCLHDIVSGSLIDPD